MRTRFHLYFDDTGNRDPDHVQPEGPRRDGMDCFGLGGIIVKELDIDKVVQAHIAFCKEHKITYPLHSHKIRGGRERFGWLKTPEKAGIFLSALEEFLLSLPITAVACVVDRPGYVTRYKDKYKDGIWMMCKTAFSILVERSAKFVSEQSGVMEIYFEQSGEKEDRDIQKYMKEMKNAGMAFDQKTSDPYAPLSSADFKRICLGKPIRKTKDTPMIQIADLVLYPMAKAGYEPGYRPFVKLKEAGKLIDCSFKAEDIAARGIKYSCFDAPKTKGPDEAGPL